MIVWDILRKVILISIIIVLTLIECCGTFLTGIINLVINLIALLLLLIAGLSALLEIVSGTEALRMVAVALGGVIIGNLMASCVGVITAIRNLLMDCVS